MEIIVATNNPDTLAEAQEILKSLDVKLLSLQDAGIESNPQESGATLEENARIKAQAAFAKKKAWVLADDSGLFIEGLHGQPGVQTAYWAGDHVSVEDACAFALEQMKSLTGRARNAYLQTVLVLLTPDGDEWVFEGRVDGVIADKASGTPIPGLQYYGLFIPKGRKKTFAELSAADRNNISNRAKAYHELRTFLMELLETL